MAPKRIIRGPQHPHRGPCEVPVRTKPKRHPNEAPVPIKFPKRDVPIEVPNWPQPAVVPVRNRGSDEWFESLCTRHIGSRKKGS